MFKVIDSDRLGNGLFRLFSWIGVLLAVGAVAWTEHWPTALTAAGVNLLFATINCFRWYRRLPGMIAIAAFNILYLQIPVAYFSVAYADYDFAASTAVPRATIEYASVLNPAIWQFVFAYLAMVFGMRLVWREPASLPEDGWPAKRLTAGVLVAGAVVVTAISWNDISNIFIAQAELGEKAESRLALLFNDRMFQLLFPVLFFAMPGRLTGWPRQLQYGVGALLFLWLNLFATSKAALMAVGVSFFINPAAIFYGRQRAVYWPSTAVLLVGLLVSGPLYFVSLVDRQARLQGEALALGEVWGEVTTVLNNLDDTATDTIATRLAVNLNNFVLIVREFDGSEPEDYRAEVGLYMYRSLMNLMLPGTPYPDAYSLSSQQFGLVIAHQPLLSNVSKADYLLAANTQPYTLFGVLALFGGLAFLVAAAAAIGAIYALVCRTFTSALNRAVIVTAFVNLYGCFAVESAVQFAVILALTSYVMAALLWLSAALFGAGLPKSTVPTTVNA